MSSQRRGILLACLFISSSLACRDEGLVGEGSACPNACPVNERCMAGACVPERGGAAGDDSDRFDEDEPDRDGPGDHDNDGPGDGLPDDGAPDDGPPDDH